MITKIWERYFVFEILKTAFFFLFSFYGLYVLIDYANRTTSFHHTHTHFKIVEVLFYYAYEFIKKAEILVPLALLIATIRTLTTMNQHNEIVALRSSGLSVQTLMRPLFYLGLIVTCLLYVNTEFLLPKALKQLKLIDEARSSKKSKLLDINPAKHLILEDGSTLIFQSYNSLEKKFSDVYWIKNIDEVLHMQTLFLDTQEGHFVDHLKRNENQEFANVSSSSHLKTDIKFNMEALFETITLPEELSITMLWEKLPNTTELKSEKETQIVSAFYQKMLLPWAALFAIIAPIPYCLVATRNLPIFFIYAGSLFCFIAWYLLIGASVLLGKRQVADPSIILWPTLMGIMPFFLWKFFRFR